MTTQEFLQLATTSISDDPISRVPQEMQEIINNPNNTTTKQVFFDVHSHCFVYNNIPSGFPGIGIHPPLWVLKALKATVKGIGKVVSIGGIRESLDWEYQFKGRFLDKIIKGKTSDDILMYHLNLYNMGFRKKYFNPPHIIMVQLMMDMERGIKGKVEESFYNQIVELSELRSKRKHNLVVLPYFAADPRNPNLYKDFLAVFSDLEKRKNHTGVKHLDSSFPFFGLKIYPSLGYFPSASKLMQIYRICEAKNIPVLSHCGGGSTHYNKGKYIEGDRLFINEQGQIEGEKYKINAKPKEDKKEYMAKIFNDPDNWLPVIKTFPKLKVNLAHFGSTKQWENYRNGKGDTHISRALNIILNHENVYADISYACATDRNLKRIQGWFEGRYFSDEQQKILFNKVLYGSDYFLTDRKKSMVTIVESIIEELKPDLLNQLCIHNPKKYLFSKVTN